MIKVTCAIIQYQNKTLAVQRGEEMSLPTKWEFPGGKIEPGESEKDCLIREIKEELNIIIEPINRLTPSIFHYPNISIELIPYLSNYISGDLKLIEHKSYLWLSKEELKVLDWAEADVPIVNEYLLKD